MADIADADLPVFPFRVNWRNGISERLEWKTDILTDYAGNEQRRGLRLDPRREFEVTLTLWDQERAFLDLWMHRVGGEFLFPIWHDSVRAAQEAAQGQNTIWVDTRGLGFEIGSYALLRGLTAMSFERVQIADVQDDRIVTVEPLVGAWPKGTRVEPLVRGWMSNQTRTSIKTSRASETQAIFQTTREQPYSEGTDTLDQYLGLPVLAQAPNRTEALDMQFAWTFSEADSETGRRYRRSDHERAMVSQKHAWMLRGRVAKDAFRSMIYRTQGALKPMWLPTFNDDLEMAQDTAVGGATIYVKAVGFAYTGGPTSGREHICIQTRTGRIYRRVTGTAVAPAGQERLVLDAPIPAGLNRSDVRRISWMDMARLENDRVEFNHVNAADGVTTVASILRTFRDDRTAPAVLSYPIPIATMTPWACGDGAFEPVFEGWYIKIRVDWINPSTPAPGLGYNIFGYGGAGFLSYVSGPPRQVEVPFEYIEFTYLNEGAYNIQDWELLLQFRGQSVEDDMRGQLSYRRWDQEDYVVAVPGGDSYSTTDPFDVRSLAPCRYYFTF